MKNVTSETINREEIGRFCEQPAMRREICRETANETAHVLSLFLFPLPAPCKLLNPAAEGPLYCKLARENFRPPKTERNESRGSRVRSRWNGFCFFSRRKQEEKKGKRKTKSRLGTARETVPRVWLYSRSACLPRAVAAPRRPILSLFSTVLRASNGA